MSRLDVLRSFLRGAAQRAGETLLEAPVASRVREVLTEVASQRTSLRDDALTAAVAHAPGVASASVTCLPGVIRIDASFTSGEELRVILVPEKVRFAPRGAKELLFSVRPPAEAANRRVADVASALAGLIAHALWSVALGPAEADVSGAIVEREGANSLRVDLRTVPAARQLINSSRGMVAEVLELESLEVFEGQLGLKLKLPRVV